MAGRYLEGTMAANIHNRLALGFEDASSFSHAWRRWQWGNRYARATPGGKSGRVARNFQKAIPPYVSF